MKKENIKIKGVFSVYNRATGELVYRKENVITDDGLGLIADRMIASSPSAGWLAVGDDTTPVSATDTTMGNELFRKAFATTSSPGNTARAETTVDSTEAQFVWKELGIFNASTGGTMFSHVNVDYDHPTFGINVNVVYEVTFTRA